MELLSLNQFTCECQGQVFTTFINIDHSFGGIKKYLMKS